MGGLGEVAKGPAVMVRKLIDIMGAVAAFGLYHRRAFPYDPHASKTFEAWFGRLAALHRVHTAGMLTEEAVDELHDLAADLLAMVEHNQPPGPTLAVADRLRNWWGWGFIEAALAEACRDEVGDG